MELYLFAISENNRGPLCFLEPAHPLNFDATVLATFDAAQRPSQACAHLQAVA